MNQPAVSVTRGFLEVSSYSLRNVIERTFCRIKDFRGIATLYDKTARNFLAAVCLVSAITYRA